MIIVESPGALTLVQDAGRVGFGSHGVPPSGAFDPWSMRAANLVVANDGNAAVLEITLRGPVLRFEHEHVVALAGSRFDADIEPGRAIVMRTGSTLRIGRAIDGARCYLAVRGGIATDTILGARSTHVTAGLGEPLRANAMIALGNAAPAGLRRLRARPSQRDHVRALKGPQWRETTFFERDLVVSTHADRTGVRLDGDVGRASDEEIDPEPASLGAVQVPHDGSPIVLGPDRPITGGYPKIAVVVRADIDLIARARPGDTLRFVPCTVEHAREAFAERERALYASVEEL
ncbi:MAG: biotin-dependent carboxyltransferase family protein [Actinomycetota bacterium]